MTSSDLYLCVSGVVWCGVGGCQSEWTDFMFDIKLLMTIIKIVIVN